LNEGEYRLELNLSLHFRDWFCQPGVNAPAIALMIQGGLSNSPYWMIRRPGLLAPVFQWEICP
jgi:lipopolysaccharide transport system ATP-binding protein